MTSISKAPFGEVSRFIQQLHSAGMTYEDLQRVNQRPHLAARMYDGLVQPDRGDIRSWYLSPEAQLKKVETIASRFDRWQFTEPEGLKVPTNFTPRTESEILMLSVYLRPYGKSPGLIRTMQELWQRIKPPRGHSLQYWDSDWATESWSGHFTLLPGYDYRPGVRWVGFDPYANKGVGLDNGLPALDKGVELAGSEVMMAMMFFPEWIGAWDGNEVPFPIMGGINRYSATGNATPYFTRRTNRVREVELSLPWTDEGKLEEYALPTVRELDFAEIDS